jgi:MFS family permease
LKRFLFYAIFLLLSIAPLFQISADDWITGTYLTGVNCPNCAATDPIVLRKALDSNPKFILFEYEIHKYGKQNREIALEYFNNYLENEIAGVPCLILNKENVAIGRMEVPHLADSIIKNRAMRGQIPLSDGTSVSFSELDLTSLPGFVHIWHRNRILVPKDGTNGDNEALKKVFTADSVEKALRNIKHEKVEAFDIQVAKDYISFDHAVKIGDWILLWKNDAPAKPESIGEDIEKDGGTTVSVGEEKDGSAGGNFAVFGVFLLLLIFFIFYLIDRKNMIKAGTLPAMSESQKNFLVVGAALVFLVGFFFLATTVSPSAIEDMGYQLPLPLFTLMIALVDGFNPCNMFVLTFLMALIVSSTHSRLRIYIVGYSFVFMVYIIYFLFMSAWLNIFKYIGFIDPLRITIAVIALVAGAINCKELLFFKKGISLTTGDKGRSFLDKKTRNIRGIIKNGSLPVLVASSITLGFFASLIELPCTAGFPIVYTTVLSGLEIADSSFTHYFWIAMYNLFYIIPLAVIIFVFGFTFRGKAISESAVQRMKFIGGFIMIVLGIILLVNPAMIGLGV